MLEKIKNILYEPILFYIISGVILMCIIGYLDNELLTWANRLDVLVEAHGLLFDILFFGILYLFFSKKSDKRKDIKRYQENIDDLKGWYQAEATFKIIGNLKRLVKLRANNISLTNCYLRDGLMLGLILRETDLSLSALDSAVFQYSDLEGAILRRVSISKTNFNYCNLSNVNLKRGEGSKTLFKGAKLKGANLENANIQDGDFSFIELNRDEVGYNEYRTELLTKSYLSELDIENNIIYSNMEGIIMSYGTFNKSSFERASLKNSILNSASFKEANMDSVNFSKADLRGAIFDNAVLSNAIFDTVEFRNTSFIGADLRNATFRESNIEECNFENAIFALKDRQYLEEIGIDINRVKFKS